MESLLIVQGLTLKVSIGAYEWEKHIIQNILIDLYLTLDILAASQSDDLAAALDYAELASQLQKIADLRHYHLLESLALQFKNALIETYPQIIQAKLVVHKPTALAKAKDVAIEINW